MHRGHLEMKERIKTCIANLKHLPGVYLMHDKDDKIIYIGKAKDLFKRVSQYFLRPQVGKVAKMAFEAEYFETIITNNEKEALIKRLVILFYKLKETPKIKHLITLVLSQEARVLMRQLIY